MAAPSPRGLGNIQGLEYRSTRDSLWNREKKQGLEAGSSSSRDWKREDDKEEKGDRSGRKEEWIQEEGDQGRFIVAGQGNGKKMKSKKEIGADRHGGRRDSKRRRRRSISRRWEGRWEESEEEKRDRHQSAKRKNGFKGAGGRWQGEVSNARQAGRQAGVDGEARQGSTTRRGGARQGVDSGSNASRRQCGDISLIEGAKRAKVIVSPVKDLKTILIEAEYDLNAGETFVFTMLTLYYPFRIIQFYGMR
ncbi:hypothetical protein ACLOJK_011567 [Asimina triloba]